MDFQQLVANRESCRKFSDRLVDAQLLQKIMETARLAPSACNSQPWHFYVVNQKEKASAVAECVQELGMNAFTQQVPAFIVITEEQAALSVRIAQHLKSQEYAQMDVGIVCAHIVLQARELGLSSCILGWINEKKLKDLFGIQRNCRVRLVIALGYAQEDGIRPKKRKDMSEIADFYL